MFVEHIEALNQEEQLMEMHCSLVLSWSDSRLTWTAEDWGGVKKIVRMKYELPYIWYPQLHFAELKLKSEQIMRNFNTLIAITNVGAVFVQIELTLKTPCMFDFSDYPHDNQRCSLTLLNPRPLSEIKFSPLTYFGKHNDMFGRISNSVLKTGEFIVTDTAAERLYYRSPGLVTRNETAVTYLAGTVADVKLSLIWLMLCTLIQVVNYSQMTAKLPPDSSRIPLCGKTYFTTKK
ncbi:unnamed protein product [Enterobius vermicularis]|uniref:Neur_chan_LBD domain-containing protein n=1 Tax=Enterobius vermicularis TaxID=51028 RepID=A0A0N4V7E0_ENTVE|nr:unnamed protein product [Enterobius vermicularis]